MLRIGDQTLRARDNNVRLTSIECLNFIADQDPKQIYVGYFFDYDVAKILEDLPFGKLLRLMRRGMRTMPNGGLMPVDWNGFQIDYLPRKEFKVRRQLRQDGDVTEWSPWVVINDVGSFFQCPFLKAIKDWKVGTEDEWDAIERGKEQRSTFDISDYDEIAAYNAIEIRLLEILMEYFRHACEKAGIVPSRWQGPGLLAESMLRKNRVARSSDVPLLTEANYYSLLTFGRSAYYGGRTEVSAIGPVSVPIFQYDINSAYPHAMRVVPCLMHDGWEHVANATHLRVDDFDRPTGRKGERFAVFFASFTNRDKDFPLWFGVPVRTQTGTIVFPGIGSGWYWSFEAASSVHQTFAISEAWVYTRMCDCRPLAFVEDVYKERQAIGKDGPGIVLKLGLNSLYGKTVQSIGFPKYANSIWGSFITAIPRTMLNDFIHSSPNCRNGQCGTDVFMLATDSVATSTDRSTDYPESKELGGWSREVHPTGIFVVQPGVYFGSSGKPSKTRGVPRATVDPLKDVFKATFAKFVASGDLQDAEVRVPQVTFVGIRQSVHRRNMALLGQWIEYGEGDKKGKAISFDWSTKRALSPALAPSGARTWIQTFPYLGDTRIITVPYSKDIGGLQERDELRIPFMDQPDWTGYTWEEE